MPVIIPLRQKGTCTEQPGGHAYYSVCSFPAAAGPASVQEHLSRGNLLDGQHLRRQLTIRHGQLAVTVGLHPIARLSARTSTVQVGTVCSENVEGCSCENIHTQNLHSYCWQTGLGCMHIRHVRTDPLRMQVGSKIERGTCALAPVMP